MCPVATTTITTMLPADVLLTVPAPDGPILPTGRAVPPLRAELRRIPSFRNALERRQHVRADARHHRRRRVDRPVVGLPPGLPAHGTGARAARRADARGRPPPAVPEQGGQRLGRPLAARLPVVHADRPVPPGPHGAPPRGVRPGGARHGPLRRLPHPARLVPPQALARRHRPDGLEAAEGPVPGHPLERRRHAARGPLDRRGAARAAPRLGLSPATRSSTGCCGSCRT